MSVVSWRVSTRLLFHGTRSGSPLFRLLNRNKGTQTLVTWGDAGAAVRMGQQGGQTEALWTHLDPSKPQERLHAPAGAHARSAATCHNHTEQEASDHLHLQLKTTFSVKTTFRKEKKRGRIIKRSALLLSMCPMNAIPRCSLGGAVFYRTTSFSIGMCM